MIRVGFVNNIDDFLLSLAVYFADIIILCLVSNRECVNVVNRSSNYRSSLTRCSDGDIDPDDVNPDSVYSTLPDDGPLQSYRMLHNSMNNNNISNNISNSALGHLSLHSLDMR